MCQALQSSYLHPPSPFLYEQNLHLVYIKCELAQHEWPNYPLYEISPLAAMKRQRQRKLRFVPLGGSRKWGIDISFVAMHWFILLTDTVQPVFQRNVEGYIDLERDFLNFQRGFHSYLLSLNANTWESDCRFESEPSAGHSSLNTLTSSKESVWQYAFLHLYH